MVFPSRLIPSKLMLLKKRIIHVWEDQLTWILVKQPNQIYIYIHWRMTTLISLTQSTLTPLICCIKNKKYSTNFFLKLKECRGLSLITLGDVISGCEGVVVERALLQEKLAVQGIWV